MTKAKGKVHLTTYGCQMNVLDSELVQGQLEALGYEFIDSSEDADVVLLNTCSVRELSEHKVWSALGRLASQKEKGGTGKDPVVGVLGCMAEREGEGIISRMPNVDVLCGPSNLDQLPMLVDNAYTTRTSQVSLAGHNSRRSKTLEHASDQLENLDLSRTFAPTDGTSKAQAYVRITRGCNKFCSFCVVPYTRGPEVHRPPGHIVDEVKRLVGAGVLEVTLLGQTINHYLFQDGGKSTSFAELLWRVHEEVPELKRLRFITSYPRDFSDEALDVMAAAPRICRYLHIPAQSGSNTMLRAMNRGYTVEEYDALLERARARMPDIRLAGDMIVGFPGETDADHEASLRMLERARYKSCFIFKYSPRPNTVAVRRFEDTVPEAVKKVRNQELLELQNRISLENHQAMVGTDLSVLVEGESKLRAKPELQNNIAIGWLKQPSEQTRLIGRTQGDEIVVFDGPRSLIGSMTTVRATGATPLTIQGERLGAELENSMPSTQSTHL